MAFDINGKQIKVGDTIKRVDPCLLSTEDKFIPIGFTDKVRATDEEDGVYLSSKDIVYFSKSFEIIQEAKMPEKVQPAHKHAEVIKAWLDGYPVQSWDEYHEEWRDYAPSNPGACPSFKENCKYRIKPAETEAQQEYKQLLEDIEALQTKAKALESKL